MSQEIEQDIQSNFSENAQVARLFMAIDNIYARCIEANKAIKDGVDINKIDKENIDNSSKNQQKVKKGDRKMFEVQANCDKLSYVQNCLTDLKDIFRKDKLRHNR